MDAKILVLALAVALVGLGATVPTAQACGFEEEHHVGPIEWGMHCTMPYVEVYPEDIGGL